MMPDTTYETSMFFAVFDCPCCGRDRQCRQMLAKLFDYDQDAAQAHAVREIEERQSRRCTRCATPVRLVQMIKNGLFPPVSVPGGAA